MDLTDKQWTVSSRSFDQSHMMPFSHFTGDASSRRMLRRACGFLADVAGSGRCIYTHELMPRDGESLEEIEAGLRERIGPPAVDFAELHAAELFGPRAWYIDTFSDLRSVRE